MESPGEREGEKTFECMISLEQNSQVEDIVRKLGIRHRIYARAAAGGLNYQNDGEKCSSLQVIKI